MEVKVLRYSESLNFNKGSQNYDIYKFIHFNQKQQQRIKRPYFMWRGK